MHHAQPSNKRLFIGTLALFALFVVWDLSALDLPLARWVGTASGFSLRDHWLWSKVLHQGARRVAWTLQFALVLAIWWPVGPLRLLTRRQRASMFVAMMLSLLIVYWLKNASTTSCPWDLAEFGGNAVYISHWSWGVADGGVGRCFPAGHASAAFCLLPGYFWLREKAPRQARLWLYLTVLAGAVISLAQQMRGAHYLSHSLWTGWICWVIAALSHAVLESGFLRRLFTPAQRERP